MRATQLWNWLLANRNVKNKQAFNKAQKISNSAHIKIRRNLEAPHESVQQRMQ